MRGDNAKLRAFDEAAGWIEEDGTSPALVAESKGVAGHIIGKEHGLPIVVWEDEGVWSYCVLNHFGLGTTLLARSKAGMLNLLHTLHRRVKSAGDAKKWQSYYEALWEGRYRKWCCAGNKSCDCQLCRMS